MAREYDTAGEVTRDEHISPDKTGDNISAKRSALYVFNPNAGVSGEWQRMSQPGGLTPGTDFDFYRCEQTSDTLRTYTFLLGGSGGETVRTVTVTYVDSSREEIDTVEYS